MSSSGRLRVEPHIRGHIASCNGRVELVKTRVESYTVSDDAVALNAQELQARAEEARRLKEERLLAFQRDVKERVRRKERARLKQISETANTHHLTKEPSAEVKKNCSSLAVSVTEPESAVQRARLSLLSASRTIPHPPPPLYHHQSKREESCHRPLTPASPPPPPPASSSRERSSGRRFTAPDRLAHDRRKSQAQQLHLFHRLYSQLEREKARQRRLRLALQGNAEQRKRENEIQRRMAEEEDEEEGVVVSVGSWEEEEMERLEVWQQTLALEKRRHQLQVARETERYLEALRAQLRDRLASCPTPPPPLCSCGSSLWDTDPLTCANNCPFYQNPRAYATALSNLITSLKF